MVNIQFATSVHIMMSLGYRNLGTDKCLDKLAEKYNVKLPNSEYLAESTQTNPVVVRRLLSQLNKAGLIKSARGKNGGVQLSRAAAEISLKDIYVALEIEEPLKPHNKPPSKDCPVSCSIHEIMSTVCDGYRKATLKHLEAQKLSDLIKKIKSSKA